jgi:hypothetical protein
MGETTRGTFLTIKRNKLENGKKDEVVEVEVIDPSNEDETKKHVIDVDICILHFLLLKAKQEPRTGVQD